MDSGLGFEGWQSGGHGAALGDWAESDAYKCTPYFLQSDSDVVREGNKGVLGKQKAKFWTPGPVRMQESPTFFSLNFSSDSYIRMVY